MNQRERARAYALEAHGDQKRKFTGEPYIVHPDAVAATLEELGYDDEVIAAAYLHDVPEDTFRTEFDLWHEFSERTCDIVVYSTEISRKEDGTRKARKRKDHEFYAQGPEESQSLKLADSIDNTPSIVIHNPKFGRVYVNEKTEMHELLTKAHPVLRDRHAKMLKECRRQLFLSQIPDLIPS